MRDNSFLLLLLLRRRPSCLLWRWRWARLWGLGLRWGGSGSGSGGIGVVTLGGIGAVAAHRPGQVHEQSVHEYGDNHCQQHANELSRRVIYHYKRH